MDSSLVPLHQPAGPFTSYCDADEILAFAMAVNDPNPLYVDGLATPPTYAVVPVFEAYLAVGPSLATDNEPWSYAVHGTHDLYIHQPIEPASHLHTTSERCAVIVSRAGMNIVVKLTSVNDAGELVITQYWSAMMPGPVTGVSRGEELADHTFTESMRAGMVGTVSVATDRDQPFRYAGASRTSGDRPGTHNNDEVARQHGFPRKFNQGLLTLGVVTRGLVELTAGGDPRRVRRIATRFTAPTYPGDEIQVSAYDLGRTGQGLHSFAFEAASGDSTVLRHGRVEVAD